MICARINKVLVPLATIMCVIAIVMVMMPSPPIVNPNTQPVRQVIKRPDQLITLEKPINGTIQQQG
ncbi:MAG: hypothetical protein IJI45_03380 [Anaerolineaceae bacterium]|nr:hypothetical protein [Anaerolineaceae bacterium]